MGRKLLYLLGCAAALPSTVHANDAEEVVLTPISQWHLDMAESKCRLARQFGDKANPHLFYLEQWAPNRAAQWVVAGPSFDKYRDYRTVSYQFGPDGDGGEIRFVGGELGEYGMSIDGSTSVAVRPETSAADTNGTFRSALPSEDRLQPENAKAIDRLTVSQKSRTTVHFALGPMAPPLRAMNVCMEDLVASWGFTAEQVAAVAKPAAIENYALLAREVAKRYPKAALIKGEQADFFLRINIDDEGKVTHCSLLNSTAADDDFELRKGPCEIFSAKARITPALDANGKGIATYLTTRIVYRMGR